MGSIYLALIQLVVVGLGFSRALAGQADFRNLYSAGYLIRASHGDQIYDYKKAAETEAEVVSKVGPNFPFIHPAYEGLLFAPLSFFSYKKAFWVFFALNVALLVTACRLMMPASEWIGEIWRALPVMMAGGFLPVGICLVQGQDTILLLLILAGAYRLEKNGKDFTSGLILGLGMFRFQLVIPLVVWSCFERKWKLLAGFGLTCLGMGIVSALVVGPSSLIGYPRYLLAMSGKQAYGMWPMVMPNLRGLISLLFAGWVPVTMLQSLTMAASLALLGGAIVKRVPYELMIVVALLVSYHGYIHDSVLLLLPLLKCRIPAGGLANLRLVIWSTVLAAPTLAFVMRVPWAALGLVYLVFVAAMTANRNSKGNFRAPFELGPI